MKEPPEFPLRQACFGVKIRKGIEGKESPSALNSRFPISGNVGKPSISRICPPTLVLPIFPVASDKSLPLFKPQDPHL